MAGKTRNIGIDGRKNQKVLIDSSATRAGLCVSRNSQIIARSEVSGSDATNPPQPGYRRAISDTAATMAPESAALIRR